MLSRDGLARSALRLHACFLTRLLGWTECCHEMVWLGQPFVSPLVCICLPTCFLTRLLGWVLSRDGLARSGLCLPLVSFCFSTCFLPTCLPLSLHLFSHSLAGLGAVTRWSGSVSPNLLGWMLSQDDLARSALCLPAGFLLSPHLFPHAFAELDAECCHEMVWLGQPIVSPLVCISCLWLAIIF